MPKWTIMPGSTQFNTGGNYQYLTLSILLIFKLIDHCSETEPKKRGLLAPFFYSPFSVFNSACNSSTCRARTLTAEMASSNNGLLSSTRFTSSPLCTSLT
ncbi:hypothetical protein CITSP_02537 [Citrobacter sp. T1.2D-1]|nr:hypothetical protein CITSP_02537 [Citrobacter sp. T1.2D-1]